MTVRAPISTLAVLLALAACSSNAREACGGSDQKFYDDGLILYLDKSWVSARRTQGGGICVEEKYRPQLKAAERELDRYFPEIAHKPRDACEERALAEWAKRENLRYDLKPSFDMSNRPAGNLFLLRAYTREEMLAYREKLERHAPKDVRCGTAPR